VQPSAALTRLNNFLLVSSWTLTDRSPCSNELWYWWLPDRSLPVFVVFVHGFCNIGNVGFQIVVGEFACE